MHDLPVSKRVLDMKKASHKKRVRILVLFLVLFFSLVVSVSYFSFHKKITLSNIVVSGNNIIDTDDIEKVVKDNLSGRYVYLFSRANFLFYPKNKIYKDLNSSFPRIEELSISRKGFNSLEINIKERSGTYLYCGKEVPLISSNIGDNCFFVNKDGFIFDKAPYFSGNVYFKYYVSLGGDGSPLGKQLFTEEKFKEITNFIDDLFALSFKPAYMIVDEKGFYTIYLEHKPLSTSPKILLKNTNDLKTVFDNISSSMKKKEFSDEINQKYDRLEYIDLRFKNKVLYKFNE